MNILQKLSRLAIKYNGLRFSSIKSESKKSGGHWLLLTIPAASFGLGTWQVRRLEWKRGLIKELEARVHCDAVPLPNDILSPGKLKEMEYKRVIVQGKFDHRKEIILGPRSKNELGIKSSGLISRPNSGFQIVTPFVLDSGQRILINRGWVSKDERNSNKRQEGQVEDFIKITGLVRIGEKRPQFSPKVQQGSLNWHYCDVDSFSQLLDTSPILLDADSASSIPGGPIGGQTRVNLRNEHMQYIITWYSLCAATLVLYYQFRKQPAALFRSGPKMTGH